MQGWPVYRWSADVSPIMHGDPIKISKKASDSGEGMGGGDVRDKVWWNMPCYQSEYTLRESVFLFLWSDFNTKISCSGRCEQQAGALQANVELCQAEWIRGTVL